MKKLLFMLALTSYCHAAFIDDKEDDPVQYIEYDVKDDLEGVYYFTKTKIVDMQKELKDSKSFEMQLRIVGRLEAYADILDYIITHD